MSEPKPRFKVGDRVRLIATREDLIHYFIPNNRIPSGYKPGEICITLGPPETVDHAYPGLFSPFSPLSSTFSPRDFHWTSLKESSHNFPGRFCYHENFFELAEPKTSTEITEDAYLLL